MKIVFAMVVLLSTYKAGGLTTVGPFEKLAQCEQQAAKITALLEPKARASVSYNKITAICIPVNSP